jgi:hypothetical protein
MFHSKAPKCAASPEADSLHKKGHATHRDSPPLSEEEEGGAATGNSLLAALGGCHHPAGRGSSVALSAATILTP